MADGEQGEVVAAEADECSRWIMAGLSCCAGVSLFCIILSVRDKDDKNIPPFLAALLIGLGYLLCSLPMLMLIELCSGIYICQWRRLADEMLMFFN
jgi:hypothetical protein